MRLEAKRVSMHFCVNSPEMNFFVSLNLSDAAWTHYGLLTRSGILAGFAKIVEFSCRSKLDMYSVLHNHEICAAV